ncbi:MAG TPA: FAD-dependent oxidoreductase [Armatimonadota bacterium]|nr:FAD-dependent oxidoreductase [Armatimonadota bacterium]
MHSLTVRIDEEITCDVLVIGGGMAAICAAIAAARNGCDTALVEMDEMLGGNSSPLLGVHVSGAHSFHPFAAETGIIEELELEAAHEAAKTRTFYTHYNISHQWDLVLAHKLHEAGVRIFRRHQGRRAIVDGRRIIGALVEDIQHFQTKLFNVRHGVIDGSGDGTVAADAGASYMMGTESSKLFGERSGFAENAADTMGTSITALVLRRDQPIDFVMPAEFHERATHDGAHEQLSGYPSCWNPQARACFLWCTESGGGQNTIHDDAEIRQELLYQLYRCWDNVKHHSFVEEARNWELVWVSPKSGKRESRRFIGDIVLTQTDVEATHQFDDSIGFGGYGIDVHEVDGKGSRIVFYSVPPLWNFPYRASYSRDFDNLWLAGRLMSVSHLALGTVRLMRTLAGIGQGVGTAVALAMQHACPASDIYTQHRNALQQCLLRQDATILAAANTDPLDLARHASVTASSEMSHGATRISGYLPLDIPRGVQLWDWAPTLNAVDFYVRNTSEEAQHLTLHLQQFSREVPWKTLDEFTPFIHISTPANRMEWGNDNTVEKFVTVAETTAIVPADFDGWVTCAFPLAITMMPVDETSDENRYNLLLDACPGIELGVDEHQYDFALRLYQPENTREFVVDGNSHAFRLTPAPQYGEATNVIDGHHRRYSTNPVHAWLSDFDAPLPQSITLTFPSPTTISSVQLTFDTLERSFLSSPINCDDRHARRCVSDYTIEVDTVNGWQEITREEGNYQRHCIHTFTPRMARALRLTVTGVNDDHYRARVYEIRVYGQAEEQ